MKAGWRTESLGDVCQVIGGGTPSKAKPSYFMGDIAWATVRDMRSELLSETEFKITKDAVKNSSTNIIPQGNVVIATRVGLGKVCLVQQDTAINQDLRGVVPNDITTLSVQYLFSWLKSISHKIVEEGTGATVQGVKLPFIKSLKVPIPPIVEQQRIVAILDQAFEGIAKARANAEQNLQNARALFESHLQSVFTQRGEEWIEARIEDCFKLKSGDGLTSSMMKSDGIYSVFGGNGIAGKFDKFNLSGSNVIIGRVGALCGNVRYILDNIWLTDNAFRVVDYKFDLDHVFLTYLLNYKNLREFARQAAQPVISNSSLKDVILNFPKSLAEQKTIVAKLDLLREETQRLEALYQRKITLLDELKKSLLQQAFAGEL